MTSEALLPWLHAALHDAPYVVAGLLLVAGIAGIANSTHLVHLAACLSVVQSSTYVLLVCAGFRTDGTPPVFNDELNLDDAHVDPVVQALTLTDIVVGVVFLAMVLALGVQMYKRFGTLHPGGLRRMRA
jgi:multicomponent Na+:H+ antiporter subunit C